MSICPLWRLSQGDGRRGWGRICGEFWAPTGSAGADGSAGRGVSFDYLAEERKQAVRVMVEGELRTDAPSVVSQLRHALGVDHPFGELRHSSEEDADI